MTARMRITYKSAPSPFTPVVGKRFREWINQGYRECNIEKVTKTRMLISYELPLKEEEVKSWRRLNEDGTYTPVAADRVAL